ncbi:MAG: AMP-binding protein, partial [Betaproteobacteria bacterium]|nr:AMP-binding protein [Betaproteobacteria bacterium]
MPDAYQSMYQSFRWKVPEQLNIEQLLCSRWAKDAGRVAIRYESDNGQRSTWTYRDLHLAANRLASSLRELGVERGDRVALVLPQRPITAVAHLAIYRLGAIAMPLSILFGPEALAYRLADSEAMGLIADASALDTLRAARPDGLRFMAIAADVDGPDLLDPTDAEFDVQGLIERGHPRFTPVKTLAAEPAQLLYTSGTTGPPKGALIPHRALIGNLPGFVASQNWFPDGAQCFWSPADWAWTGGLMDALLPSLYFGQSILAYKGRFSGDKAYELIERYAISHAFLFPTALKAMLKSNPSPSSGHALKLRAVMSAGEAVGHTLYDWCQAELGVTVNEMFGQTEMNYVVGNCSRYWTSRSGSIGRPYPGHRVAVIDDDGVEVPDGSLGEIAVHRQDIHGDPDPVFFIEYWRNLKASDDKFTGNWCRTGDLATRDADGFLWYAGRTDDMFKAAGYRIGPGEIENCLLQHPEVANVAVVPKPDQERGNLVKAFVVLSRPEHYREGSQREALIQALQAQVKRQLAPYEYPKEIEFIESLPMTTTGKVQRVVLRR